MVTHFTIRKLVNMFSGTSIHIATLDGVMNVGGPLTNPCTDNPYAMGTHGESDPVSIHMLAFTCSSLASLHCLKQLVCTYPCPPSLCRAPLSSMGIPREIYGLMRLL